MEALNACRKVEFVDKEKVCMVVICLPGCVELFKVVQEARGAADVAAPIPDLASGPVSGEDDGAIEVNEGGTLVVKDNVTPADIAVDDIVLVQPGDGLEDVVEIKVRTRCCEGTNFAGVQRRPTGTYPNSLKYVLWKTS